MYLPTNFPMGILASMGPDLAGSLQANAAISVQVTVGLTEFTRIYKKNSINYIITYVCDFQSDGNLNFKSKTTQHIIL